MRRSAILFGVAALLLVACGDDSSNGSAPTDSLPVDTVAPIDTTAPPATAPPTTAPSGFEHPTGADDVVVRIAYEGGFIIGRMLKDPHELARQLRNYRTLLEFSFAP